MNRYMVTAIGIAGAIAPVSAMAATVIGSPGQPAGPGIYFDYTANAGGTFGNTDPTTTASKFLDTFVFNTNFSRLVTVEILSTLTDFTKFTDNVNFVSNGVRLNAQLIPATSTGTNERRFLANFRIPAGVQNIVVNGSAGPAGAYNGSLSLVSDVPEPATWAFMILGFGFVGGMMRRRGKVTTKVAFA